MAPGTYSDFFIRIASPYTSAASIAIHGGGSRLENPVSELLLDTRIPTWIRDLTIVAELGFGVFVQGEATFERVRIRSLEPLKVVGGLTATDLVIESLAHTGLSVDNGSLRLERGTISGGTHAIVSQADSLVDISNVLAYGTSDIAFDLQGTGSVSFVTIADSGATSDIAGGIRCSTTPAAIVVRSSIVWTPSIRPAGVGGCAYSTSIVGPNGVVGAMDIDPLFVNSDVRDYHLRETSPAIDMAVVGPANDFEGESRPRGARFDIGADESR